MADLDPDLLRAFLAIADFRSFTRAAGTLNRTQSAISMQIKRLEERLGVALFDRTKSQIELTAAGDNLLLYARRILALNEEAVGRLAEHKTEGRVRLGVMDDYGTVLLPPLLANFAAEFPCIAVEMETGLASGMKTRLGTDFDIVISIHPEGSGGGTFLRHEQPVWATGFSQVTEKFDPMPVALYPQGCLFRKWGVDALNASNRRWRLAYVSHSLAAVEAIAALGLAITIVKSGTFPAQLRPLSEQDGMPALPMSDVRLHRVAKPPRATALLADYIVSHLKRPE